MLIPIGQENAIVRRHPWMSWAIVATCVVVHIVLYTQFDRERWSDRLGARLEAIASFVAEHPYLEAPPEVTRYFADEFLQQLDEARHALQEQKVWLPTSAEIEAARSRLEGLVGEYRAVWSESPIVKWGFAPARPSPLRFVTCLFVHVDLAHLLGNLLFFFLCGPFIEDRFGRPLFLAFYLAAGFVATAAHVATNPGAIEPLVGASGAIAGVMGAFLIRLGRERIRFLFMPFLFLPWLRTTFGLPAFVVLPFWLGEQVWQLHRSEGGGGVAIWAHIGGFAFGAGLTVVIRVLGIEERFIHPAIEKQITLQRHPSLERSMMARSAGDLERARIEIRRATVAMPNEPDVWNEAYELALATSSREDMARIAPRLLEIYLRLGEKELAESFVRDARTRAGALMPARFWLAAGVAMERFGDARAAIEIWDELRRRFPDDPLVARALLRRGMALRRAGDGDGARSAFAAGRAHPAVEAEVAVAIDAELARVNG